MLRLAASDNSLRRDFDDTERVREICALYNAGESTEQIGRILGLSKETVARYLNVASHDRLREFLEEGYLPYSKLSSLGKVYSEASEDKKDKIGQYITETLNNWLETAEEQRDAYKKDCEDKGKKPSGPKSKVAGWLDSGMVHGWTNDLEEGKKPAGDRQPRRVGVENQKGKVKVSAF